MAVPASFHKIKQRVALNYIAHVALLAPVPFETHRNPAILKSKLTPGKQQGFTKAGLPLPGLHARSFRLSPVPFAGAKETVPQRHATTWA